MLGTVQLMTQIIKNDKSQKDNLIRFINILSKQLKVLVSNYDNDYDINGVCDPFLQSSILILFKQMAMKDQKVSNQISDILANVITNMQTNNKNSGNSVLLECIKTITSIESSQTLKKMAIKITSQLLKNKDNNGKYVSLYTL